MSLKKLIAPLVLSFASLINSNAYCATTLAYTSAGTGFPLVLIHAFPADHRMWAPQVERLQTTFRVITPDLAGFGPKAKTNGKPITMRAQADRIKALLDTLKIKKAIIGGESMGGYIALEFLKNYPDNVAGLILSDTRATPDSDEAKLKREASAKDVLAIGTDKLIDDFMPKALSAHAPEYLRSELRDILSEQPATGLASALRGMAEREDTSNVLAATTLPVLIISGDQDAIITPEESNNMHKLAKNSQFVLLKNAGHLSSYEQPEHWSESVLKMFSSDKSKT